MIFEKFFLVKLYYDLAVSSYKSKCLIERQQRLLQRTQEENGNLRAENTTLKSKNRRMKQIFKSFGNRFRYNLSSFISYKLMSRPSYSRS